MSPLAGTVLATPLIWSNWLMNGPFAPAVPTLATVSSAAAASIWGIRLTGLPPF